MIRSLAIFVAVSFSAFGFISSASSGEQPKIGSQVAAFQLQDFRGKEVKLADFEADFLVVAFLGTECPLAKLYAPRLSALNDEFANVGFVGINANSQDSITEMRAYAEKHGINFPLLKDSGNRVADQMNAVRTPEVFVLDKDRKVQYWGRIDDQYGVGYIREKPTRNDLQTALKELLAGKAVTQPICESVGCHIGRVREANEQSEVTYSNQIVRILRKNCVECHRAGEIAPFALTDYDEVVGWAETIAEVVRDQRMPPWHANPKYGHFTNARLMSDEDKRLIYQWVENGAPKGDASQIPEPPKFAAHGWTLPRKPDVVLSMRDKPFNIPAEGTVEYQYFVVDPGFKEDKYVTAAEVIPGNRGVVHHSVIFVRPPGGERQRGIGWLTAYVPGQSTNILEEGQARYVPAGSKLVFQQHYTPNGSPQQDLTKLGLIFADPKDVEEEVVTVIALNRNFEIPPGASDHKVEAWESGFPSNGKLLAIAPHMHLRGKSFRFIAHRNGAEQIVLDVPNYDFNWQHAYKLAEPKPVKDMRIQCIAHFDNSEDNLVNPDPSQTVRWGDQTWEEMVVAYFDVAVPKGTTAELNQQRNNPGMGRKTSMADQRKQATGRFKRLDSNGDGKLTKSEVPNSFEAFAFKHFDSNKDEIITLEEFEKAATEMRRNR